eukprot:Skav228412  [mRNA]  locus=scaffold1325:62493:65111:+ [translate_table: standard]
MRPLWLTCFLCQTHCPRLRLLAYVFAFYSITATGDEFMSFLIEKKRQGQDVKTLLGGVRTPHNMQVLAILRFFGFGDRTTHLANQLVQVETGGGKSLILGAAATLFAMLGFNVRVACYSDYLSSRDAKDFHETFSSFTVLQRIQYSKITTFSEDLVAAKGDIRSLMLELFAGKKLSKQVAAAQADASKNQVLLVDEVDVFMGPEFIARTHDQVARLQHPSIRKVLENLWQKRSEANTLQGAQKLSMEIASSPEYQEVLQDFKEFELVVESQVRMMCTDLHDYMQKTHPMPEYNPVQDCIGYKMQDRIDCGAVSGYKTAYAHLDEQNKINRTETLLDQALSMLVPAGQFAYTNISPRYIFGVSATIEQLQPFQRQEVKKHGLHVFTTLPSVYGKSKFRFLEQDDAIKVVSMADFHQEIASAIQEKIQRRRAVIVFFHDEPGLEEFRRSSFCAKLPAVQVLVEKLSYDEKASVIKKAANTRQITLATAPFGRGSDFVSYDEKLEENGGVHVLQTFLSADSSEEAQYWGRTARQGKKGSYGLIVRKGYEKIKSARAQKLAEKFADFDLESQKASEKDTLSRHLFDQLLDGNRAKATPAYLKFYDLLMQSQAASAVKPGAHHYVICLDESWSMFGHKFVAAFKAVADFLASAARLHQGSASAVSLVMFSETSRVLCNQTPLKEHVDCMNSIKYMGGDTSFDAPLEDAMRLVLAANGKYDKQFILLYTDGVALYPAQQVADMKSFKDSKGSLDFFAIAEEQAQALDQICETMYPGSPVSEHCMSNVKPQEISGAMQDTLHRMNLAFVHA